jgi:hypothetical protein
MYKSPSPRWGEKLRGPRSRRGALAEKEIFDLYIRKADMHGKKTDLYQGLFKEKTKR